MLTILAILLYLNVISPGGTYTTTEIYNDACQNQSQIQTIESNQNMLNQVNSQYGSSAGSIVVLDPDDVN
jgi:hypothetical protein